MSRPRSGRAEAVGCALKDWELAEEVASTLIRREPGNVMHVVALPEVMGHCEGPEPQAIDKTQEQRRLSNLWVGYTD